MNGGYIHDVLVMSITRCTMDVATPYMLHHNIIMIDLVKSCHIVSLKCMPPRYFIGH